MTKKPFDDTHSTDDTIADDRIDDVVIEFSEIIDRAVDDTLSERERAEFETRLAESVALREAYADALAVRRPLAARARTHCPEDVVDGVWSRIAQLPNTATVEIAARARTARWWKVAMPFAGAAAAVWLAVWGVSTLYSPGTESPEMTTIEAIVAESGGEYTEEELLAAVDDARVALAIFARTMNKTANLVSDDVKSSFSYPVTIGLKETWERVPPPFHAPDGASKRS